ncbi:DUF1749-domain-containing protein [Testicularia cyperi]|uniref:DUF1749-domain-containing protein n=1 Tax=Testicularia cyperi TaxID=1882483 RepID=A0A317XM13_9BASI|nr:DUF1749-domain-containing protein [Testicularia cyperi]
MPPLSEPLTGTMQLYTKSPVRLPYFDTNPSLPHTLILVGGLGDTIHSLPYAKCLSAMLHNFNFSLVEPQLSSCLGGYGQSSLEGDAQELAFCVDFLRRTESKRDGKIILMGHFTGCQDTIAYLLSSTRARSPFTRIDGAILQAPVSDREDFEVGKAEDSDEMRVGRNRQETTAKDLVSEGRGHQIVSDTAPETFPPTKADDPEYPSQDSYDSILSRYTGNSAAVLEPALSAYRFCSLFCKGGDDDFFSSDLSDEEITSAKPGSRTIGRAVRNLSDSTALSQNQPQILAIVSQKDQYVRPGVGEALAERWQKLLGPTGGFQTAVIKDADHQLERPQDQAELVRIVAHFMIAPLIK